MNDTRKVGIVLEGRDASASREINQVRDSMAGLKEDLRTVAIAAGAALAVVGAGAIVSIKAAGESQQVWNRLGVQLRNVGVDFRDVRGDIEAAARVLQDFTRFGDEDTAQVLNTLIGITGNYSASMQNLELVYDIAVAKMGGDFVGAANLVGRVMMGQTEMLARYGIVVGEGVNAMDLLRQRFAGTARGEGADFLTWTQKIRNEFGDLLETIGAGFIENARFTGGLRQVRDALKDATEWVKSNRETIDRWIDRGIDFLERIIEIAAATGRWIREHKDLIVEVAKVAAFVALTLAVEGLIGAMADLAAVAALVRRALVSLTIVQSYQTVAAFMMMIPLVKNLGGAFSMLRIAINGPLGVALALGGLFFAWKQWRSTIADTVDGTEGLRASLGKLNRESTEFAIQRLEDQKMLIEASLAAAEASRPTLVFAKGGLYSKESADSKKALEEWKRANPAIDSMRDSVTSLTTAIDEARRHLNALKLEADEPPLPPPFTPPGKDPFAGLRPRLAGSFQMGRRGEGVNVRGTLPIPITEEVGLLGAMSDFQERMAMGWTPLRQEMLETLEVAQQFAVEFDQLMMQGVVGSLEGLGSAVVDAFSNVDGAFKGLLATVAGTLGDMMIAAGTSIVLQSTAFKAFRDALIGLFPEKGIAAGAALIVAGGMVKAGVRNFLSNPSGGGGGAAAGGSMSDFQNTLRGPGSAEGPITLVIQGGLLDASDPRQADAFADMLQRLSGRRVIVEART